MGDGGVGRLCLPLTAAIVFLKMMLKAVSVEEGLVHWMVGGEIQIARCQR